MVAVPMDAGWREDRGEAIQQLESREAQRGPTGGIGFRQEVEDLAGSTVDEMEPLRYPTLLRIHGGPNGMYGVGFNNEAQILAAQGYLILMTNPRGSSGYGREFGFALWQKWGIPDFDDVMAGADHVIEQGWSFPISGSSPGISHRRRKTAPPS